MDHRIVVFWGVCDRNNSNLFTVLFDDGVQPGHGQAAGPPFLRAGQKQEIDYFTGEPMDPSLFTKVAPPLPTSPNTHNGVPRAPRWRRRCRRRSCHRRWCRRRPTGFRFKTSASLNASLTVTRHTYAGMVQRASHRLARGQGDRGAQG